MNDQAINYQAPDQLLKDRVIVVTGAGDGIGRVAAKHYAKAGATVILVGRTIEKLEAVYDEIEAEGGPTPAIYPIHLNGAVLKDYEEMHNRLEEEFGKIDGLLHNAGLLGTRRTLDQTTVESWDEVMQVNVTAEFLMTKALVPLLEKSEDASIIFTSSSVGRKGRAYWGVYAISKFAVEGMSQVLADELENTSNIRVNTLNPGATRTKMRAAAYPGEDPRTLKTAEEIMPTYLYLMGPDSQGVTGQQFNAQ